MKKRFVMFLSLFVLFSKPLIFMVFWTLFYFEYVWFIIYSSKLWYKWGDYCSISIKEVDISDLGIVELWIEYCKICAFSRLYSLLMRKRISFLNLIFYVIMLTLGLPYKLIKIFYFLFKDNGNFRAGLENLYLKMYYTYKYNKIEVLEGRIYLNCNTLLKLLIKSNVKHLSQDLQFEYVSALRKNCHEIFMKDSERAESVKFILSQVKLQGGKKIDLPHYTYFKDTGLNNYTIHPTSSLPNLEISQKAAPAMPSAIKNGSKSPATIISFGVEGIDKLNRSINIPSYEMNAALFDIVDIYGMPISRCEYTRNKDMKIHELLFKHTKNSEELIMELKKELRCGYYNYSLLNASNEDIWKAIIDYDKCPIW